ncbi:MAG: flagellin [Selenomonadaceae bacterium]
MAMVVKNNIAALNTLNTMTRNNSALTKSLQKVSSGMKINSAADDASGYAISEKMRVQIRSLDQANQNSQNGNSLLKTAEGAVSSTVDILKTLKEKVVNAANDTNTTADRQIIQKELNQAIDQINDNANVTFNGKTLVDGSMNKSITTATTSVYSNQNLSTATAFASVLTTLSDRDGNTLDIKSSDTIKISFVQNGKSYTTSMKVSNNVLSSIFNQANSEAGGTPFATAAQAGSFIGIDATGVSTYTADGTSALSISAGASGTTSQISGFSISITGTDGNVKKSINQKLDAFSETIRAQNVSGDNALTLQIGTKSNQSIKVGLTDMRAQALGLQGTDAATGVVKTIDVTTRDNANVAINVLDSAIKKALDEQTNIGAVESRLDYTSANLTTSSENVSAAESTIRDANMAKEMTEYTKNNVLMQASQAMLAQANQSTSSVLSLLQ